MAVLQPPPSATNRPGTSPRSDVESGRRADAYLASLTCPTGAVRRLYGELRDSASARLFRVVGYLRGTVPEGRRRAAEAGLVRVEPRLRCDLAELRGGEGLPVIEVAWLIERQGFLMPFYLSLGDGSVEWTTDHAAAQRYPTEQAGKDAWLAALDLDPGLEKFDGSDRPVRVTEHQWG